ncbi:MAG TPA: 50S ribosomal protein L25/general stress protein Ctc [Methylococcaceae bacterium]|nr:50S ribosomal protein L25/general stress protein Ctc [Methylococcaceae bacterium]
MSGEFVFEAESRTEAGKGGARRLRRASKVPAVLYGGHGAPEMLQLDHNTVLKSLENEAVYSHVLTIRVGGRDESAILKALQRHPSRPMIAHMDFQRVSATDKIRVHVPLHFINEATCVGVKKGGVVMHGMVEVEVVCLPGQLPEFIEVDLANVDLGQAVHLSELAVPAGVQLHALMQGVEHDLSVAMVQKIGAGAEGAE